MGAIDACGISGVLLRGVAWWIFGLVDFFLFWGLIRLDFEGE